jgi:hypothetical protein
MSMKKLLEAIDMNDVEQINETVLVEDDAAMIADELSEIKEQIKQLTYEAMDLVPREGAYAARARSYWFAHILTALDDESEFMGGSMHSMQDTIDEIAEEGAPYDQDGGDDDDDGMDGRTALSHGLT